MKLFLPYRIQPPTETQLRVFFWAVFVIFVGFGAVCLFLGYRAPPEKAAIAAQAIHWGYGSIAVAVAMYIIRRFFCGYSS
jgi:hypothetical protein